MKEEILIPQYSKNKQHRAWETNIVPYQIYRTSWEHSRRTRVSWRLVWTTRLTACMGQTTLGSIPTHTTYWAYQWRLTNTLEKCSRVSQTLQTHEIQGKTPQARLNYNYYLKSYLENINIDSSAQVWWIGRLKRTFSLCSKTWSGVQVVEKPGDWRAEIPG